MLYQTSWSRTDTGNRSRSWSSAASNSEKLQVLLLTLFYLSWFFFPSPLPREDAIPSRFIVANAPDKCTPHRDSALVQCWNFSILLSTRWMILVDEFIHFKNEWRFKFMYSIYICSSKNYVLSAQLPFDLTNRYIYLEQMFSNLCTSIL